MKSYRLPRTMATRPRPETRFLTGLGFGQSGRSALSVLAVVAAIALVRSTANTGASRPGSFAAPDSATVAIPSDTSTTSVRYFGLHIHRAVAMSSAEPRSDWPTVHFGSWRLWDAHVAWPDLEPTRGHWNFARLDALCQLAHAHGVTVLLPLGLTPQWASSRPNERSNYGLGNQAQPADTADWRRYVDTVAKRYRGQIEAYEIWNEPNVGGFYSGTPQELTELARIAFDAVKRASPAASVLTPAPSGVPGGLDWLANYLSLGGLKYADAIAFHFYVTPREPEDMFRAVQQVQELIGVSSADHVPVWNTETGWLIQNAMTRVEPSGPPGSFASRVLDDTTAAAFVARSLILGRCGSLSRFYWYAWDNGKMGLTEADGRLVKLSGHAYEAVSRWLVGAKIRSCQSSSNGTWIVRLERSGKPSSAIVWSTKGSRIFAFPDSVTLVASFELLDSTRRDLTHFPGHTIQTHALPALVEYQ